ncbi:MAG: ParB/RepB/Spo0J family partition protein [Acidobacteriota bacterium]
MLQPELKNIPINQIYAASNYRKTFREKSLAELAASIKANGVLEPIIVRPTEPGKFQIVAGERRYRASKLAGMVTIPAVIRDIATADILKVQIIENVQREGVPFMEEAYGIQKLRDDCTFDVREIAKTVGKSESYVFYMLRLCQMPEEVRAIAEKGWISKGVAWQIAKLKDLDQQIEAANALARPQRTKLITESGAKNYIRDNFGDSGARMKRLRVSADMAASDYAANWKYYLVRFTGEQFTSFQEIVRGRTENTVLAEAVDVVMRGGGVLAKHAA